VVVVVVPGVFEKLYGNVCLSVAGVDNVVVVVVGNALTGIVVAPNTVSFLNGLGPGLEVSCLGAVSEKTPGEVPVVAEVVELMDGKTTFGSVPPAGLFALKLNRGCEGCDEAVCEGMGWVPKLIEDGWWPLPKGGFG
jgi:hypothetical protein